MGKQRVYDKITYPTNFTATSAYARLLKAVKDAGTLDVSAATNEVFPKVKASKPNSNYNPANPDTHGVEALDHFGLIEFIDDKTFKLSPLGNRWLELFDAADFKLKSGLDYNYISVMVDAIFAWVGKTYGRNINVGVLLFKLLLDKRLDYCFTEEEFFFIAESSGIKTMADYEKLVETIANRRISGIKNDDIKKSDTFLSGLAGTWKILEKKENDDKTEKKYFLSDLAKEVVKAKFNQLEEINNNLNSSAKDPVPVFPESRFVAKVTGGENIIFYGVPGCGKSDYVDRIYLSEHKVGSGFSRIRTTFYHDYTNVDFVGQVLPKVNPNKSVTYSFEPGPFTIALARALADPDTAYALIIEELNRGKAASIFGDIFQLLDRNDTGESRYEIKNVNIQEYLQKYFLDERKENIKFENIKIPSNLYIVATMNTSDQNVGTLDNAFKRRWSDIKIPNEFKKKDHLWWDWLVPGMQKEGIRWYDLVLSINEFISDHPESFMNEDKQIGVYFIDKKLLAKNESDVNDDLKKRFACKFLEYLWNDIAKLIRKDELFDKPKTLDSAINDYVSGGTVFRPGIIKKHADPKE